MVAAPDMATRVLPAVLTLVRLAAALIAAFAPISPLKGLWRPADSLLVGAAFDVGSMAQMLEERKLWPGAFGFGAGVFLIRVGYRK
jgi:hypothetical protein